MWIHINVDSRGENKVTDQRRWSNWSYNLTKFLVSYLRYFKGLRNTISKFLSPRWISESPRKWVWGGCTLAEFLKPQPDPHGMLQEFLSTATDAGFFLLVECLALEVVHAIGEAPLHQRIVHPQTARFKKNGIEKLRLIIASTNYNCMV